MERRRSGGWTVLAAAALLVIQGCTYTVDSTVDAPDADPGDFVCARALPEDGRAVGDDGGLCTLRAAIEEANATIVKDAIIVPPGEYNIVLPSGAGGGGLEITQDVDILGTEAETTVVNAGNQIIFSDGGDCATLGGGTQAPVFYITSGDVFIRGMTLAGGDTQGGGGIRIDAGSVELRDAVLRDNFGFTGGGGIYIQAPATATLRRTSVVSNCAQGAFGGGIWNQGTLWVYDSTVAENESNRAGGIRNSGQMNLRNTTVSDNRANSPSAGTGGISQIEFAVLNNVTVTGNVGAGNNPASARGGGVLTTAGATTVVKNSIIAGNEGGTGPNDCVGELTFDSKHNLIGDSAGCDISGFLFTYLLDVSPDLGPLMDNGGPTRTHALQTGSPAIGAAYPFTPGGPAADACEGTDQRGVPRPQGEGVCDMGALEVTAANGFITRFVLVDAAANTDIGPLLQGDTLVLSSLPSMLSVRVDVEGSTESVVFDFDGTPAVQTENIAPYTLGGDSPPGDYDPVEFASGTHTLTATPYAGDNGTGAAGGRLTVDFNVR